MSTFKYYKNGRWNYVNGTITGDTLPIGGITLFAGTSAPTGWLFCDGSYVSKTTYAELYSAIGDDFLDGGTAPAGTFRLPNYKGRVPVGVDPDDTDFNTIGKTSGSKNHRHDFKIALWDENYAPTGGFAAMSANNEQVKAGAYKYSTGEYAGASGDGTTKTQTSGGTTSATSKSTARMVSQGDTDTSSTLQPYLTVPFIIKARQSSGVVANVSNTVSNSTTDTYSCNFINGKTGVELWTNQYPNNDFAGQTIQLSLSDYKVLSFFYTRWAGNKMLSTTICFENLTTNTELNYSDYDSGSVRSWNRNVTIKTTEIEFEDNTINGWVANSGLIPYKIIGWK